MRSGCGRRLRADSDRRKKQCQLTTQARNRRDPCSRFSRRERFSLVRVAGFRTSASGARAAHATAATPWRAASRYVCWRLRSRMARWNAWAWLSKPATGASWRIMYSLTRQWRKEARITRDTYPSRTRRRSPTRLRRGSAWTSSAPRSTPPWGRCRRSCACAPWTRSPSASPRCSKTPITRGASHVSPVAGCSSAPSPSFLRALTRNAPRRETRASRSR